MPLSELELLSEKRRPKKIAAERDTTERSIAIGIICTLLLHAIVVWVVHEIPIEKLGQTSPDLAALRKHRKTFDFQLAPLVPKPKPKPPMNFVETNPDAPTNTPDKTNNFSNRNQQSAQAEAPKERDAENRPSTKGRTDLKDSNAVVTGDHAQPQQGAAATPIVSATPGQNQKQQQARAQQIPLNGAEKVEGKSPDGIGQNVSKNPAASTDAQELVEGSRDSKNTEGGAATATENAHPTPKPRPRLSAVRSTVLADRPAGTRNIGVQAVDALQSEFGDYLNELVETVDTEWHGMVDNSGVHYPPNSHITVTFTLNSKGEVIVTTVENLGTDVEAAQCTSAITNRAPYRKWTDQMVTVLGHETSITFSFFYNSY